MFIKLLLNEGHSGAVGNSPPARSHFPDIERREGECAGAGGGHSSFLALFRLDTVSSVPGVGDSAD